MYKRQVVLGVVSGAYVGVNSYVSSQEKKESEAEDTSVELTSLDTVSYTHLDVYKRQTSE